MAKTLPTKTALIPLRIDPKLKTKLQKAALKEGRTLSDFIRRTLEEKIGTIT